MPGILELLVLASIVAVPVATIAFVVLVIGKLTSRGRSE